MTPLSFEKPLLMGILNVTPDSFFGTKNTLEQLITDGADIIDIGAESTFGPEAQVTAEEEWESLAPVLTSLDHLLSFRPKSCNQDEAEESLGKVMVRDPSASVGMTKEVGVTKISIDTYKSSIAEKALELGVHMINDVTALRGDPKMIEVLLKYKPYVCLMYSAYDTPYAGRDDKQYEDVIDTIKKFLTRQTDLLINRGFPREKIIIDPGLGFFLSTDPNVSWEVIDRLDELKTLGFPILIGPSMKSFLGGEIKDRLPKTLEASQKCLLNGVNILRVHDVKAHRKLLEI